MSVISNTTVLSNFAGIGQLDLLRQLYSRLRISTNVHAEVVEGLEGRYRFYEAVEHVLDPPNTGSWLQLVGLEPEQELRYFRECPTHLHAGEASCIAIARHRGWLLLTDDRAARREAARHGIRLSGTLGCLLLCAERNVCTLDQANSWLQLMIQQRYRSPVRDLYKLIAE